MNILKKLAAGAAVLCLAASTGCFDFSTTGGGDGGGDDGARSPFDGPGGFLWKPNSDSNGRLVVIWPAQYTGRIGSCTIHSGYPTSSKNRIETGVFSSVGNGGRAHFRFSRPGGAYGANVYASATINDGSKVTYFVANTGSRND